MRKRHAFTLVELLVVIGIIALLIAILMPALTEARKQARTIKCAAYLREIGRTFLLYAHDHKGYYPVVSWQGTTNYNLYGHNHSVHLWNAFLGPYGSRSGIAQGMATQGDEADAARDTIFWGCTEWEGYRSTAPGGFNRTGMGFGMNPFPNFDRDTPVVSSGDSRYDSFPPRDPRLGYSALIRASGAEGAFLKGAQWTRPAERALVADSYNWRIKAQVGPIEGMGQHLARDNSGTITWFSGIRRGQTMIDVYRHGVKPAPLNPNTYQPTGGRIRYNILYADGHVRTHNDLESAYVSLRHGNTGN